MLGLWHDYVHLIEWFLRQITDVTGNFGLAIIVFTILLKTAMLPLTVKSLRSTAAMQELQPKIKELQKKFGKDRQKISAETMKLYQEHHVNPAAGCLPMLLQAPIFLGLYYGVRALSRDAGYGGFLWLHDLSDPDPYHILPIMAGIFQFIQTKMMRPHNQPKVTDPQQQMMQTMMGFMPLMVVVFGWRFDSGPVIYWATQSVYSVIQQWFITGWGSLKDWAPFLPDLPEHRRLGYQKKPLTPIDPNAPPKGLFARMQAKMAAMEDTQPQRADGSKGANGADDIQRRAETTDIPAGGSGKRAKRARRQGNAPPETANGADDESGGRPKTVPRRVRAVNTGSGSVDAESGSTRRRK